MSARPTRLSRLLLPVLLLLLPVLLPVTAAHGDEVDYREVRRLREAGIIRPLGDFLEDYRRRYPGARLLESELEREDGRYYYEIKFLDPGGTVRELEYDAASGELLYIERYQRDEDGRLREYKYDPHGNRLLDIEEYD